MEATLGAFKKRETDHTHQALMLRFAYITKKEKEARKLIEEMEEDHRIDVAALQRELEHVRALLGATRASKRELEKKMRKAMEALST